MKKKLYHFSIPELLLIVLCLLFVCFIAGWIILSKNNSNHINNSVAIKWFDGKNGAAFYGVEVYLVPMRDGFSVRAKVHINRNDYYHDCGQLGLVKQPQEAVKTWGDINWQPEGLYIGEGDNTYFLPRQKIESHR